MTDNNAINNPYITLKKQCVIVLIAQVTALLTILSILAVDFFRGCV